MAGLPEAAIGAIVAALIGGVVSLIGLVISKEQKISEFRQAWIDALRTDVALVIANANAIHGAAMAGYSDLTKLWDAVSKHFVAINEATARIRLRLNPKEPLSAEIDARFRELEELFVPGRALDHREIDDVEQRLARDTQIVLKIEWDRVRNGEPTYRIAKAVAVIVVVISVMVPTVLLAVR